MDSVVGLFVLKRFEYAITADTSVPVANGGNQRCCEFFFGFEYEVVVAETMCAGESDGRLRLGGVSSSVVLYHTPRVCGA